MCGRKTLTKDKTEIIKDLFIEEWTDSFNWEPSYNIAPTHITPILAFDSKRKITPMRWGIVPSWSKDGKIGNRMINARVETLTEKPLFGNLLRSNRCIVVSDGYYEWQSSIARKQPYYIYHQNHELICIAALWDTWIDNDSKVWNTYTVITTQPADAIRHIHNRMPLILHKNDIESWLNSDLPYQELQGCLQSYNNPLTYHPVSTMVNSPVNNSKDCIQPIVLEGK